MVGISKQKTIQTSFKVRQRKLGFLADCAPSLPLDRMTSIGALADWLLLFRHSRDLMSLTVWKAVVEMSNCYCPLYPETGVQRCHYGNANSRENHDAAKHAICDIWGHYYPAF